jgi:hypothetical protein
METNSRKPKALRPLFLTTKVSVDKFLMVLAAIFVIVDSSIKVFGRCLITFSYDCITTVLCVHQKSERFGISASIIENRIIIENSSEQVSEKTSSVVDDGFDKEFIRGRLCCQVRC